MHYESNYLNTVHLKVFSNTKNNICGFRGPTVPTLTIC